MGNTTHQRDKEMLAQHEQKAIGLLRGVQFANTLEELSDIKQLIGLWFAERNQSIPRFEHNCPNCVFLGQFNEFDLYFCRGREPEYHIDLKTGEGMWVGLPTVISRYGNDGPEYTSGLCFVNITPAIGEGVRRAIARGLLVEWKKSTSVHEVARQQIVDRINEIEKK